MPDLLAELWQPPDLPTSRIKHLAPNPEGTAAVFKRMGHSLQEAIAELLDNSIDARASHIVIRFILGQGASFDSSTHTGQVVSRIVIADDGDGMAEDFLESAMQHGNSLDRHGVHIGKYGIGLKASSFSQCECVTVLSWKNGPVSGRRWNRQAIKDRWDIEIIGSDAGTTYLEEEWPLHAAQGTGTVVVWDRLDSPVELYGQSEKHLARATDTLNEHLGLYFHRFLQRTNSIRITVQIAHDAGGGGRTEIDTSYDIIPIDPFGYAESGAPGFPVDFKFRLGGHSLNTRAHIWPPKSKLPGYRIGGKTAERQGFYFYRNDRLIQAGGWNGYRDHNTEPHLSLARLKIDLPAGLDSDFRLSVQKTNVEPPRQFIEMIQQVKSGTTTFADYIRIAQEVYRGKVNGGRKTEYVPTVLPGKGFSTSAQKEVARPFKSAAEAPPAVDFVWTGDIDEDLVFDIDLVNRQVLLNSAFRSVINGGQRGSTTDAPGFKAALYLLLGPFFGRERLSRRHREQLAEYNRVLLEVLPL